MELETILFCNIDSNYNSNSNAEVPMSRFTNGPFKQREISLLWLRHYAISINVIVGFHKNFEVHFSNSLWNKKRQSIFKKREISLFWRCQYTVNIRVIVGWYMSWVVLQNPRNTSQQKFIKETDAINIQINKNVLVLMMSSRRRHYRF